ncbi:MAG: type III-B CRISPR-associated protein Cas10/Cmr2 [Fimbriimonadales bacterium]|nr:MAG: type III-B CRISPR-associated protein Cas10/Cmr2 [Fimbriimonadales bacterium]
MQNYLMTIALGPVQEFIAAARRTADLSAGSKLLVNLATHLAKWLQNEHHAELIFPANTQTGAPNKLLFTVSGEPHKIAHAAREEAHQYLREQWDKCAKSLPPAVQSLLDIELVNWQLKNFLEFYAAWVPLNGDYRQARTRLEQLLAGRKSLRDFKQPPLNPKRPKSPLDPSMDSAFKTEAHGDGFRAPEQAKSAPLRLKPRETLDAISIIKRVSGGRGVPSTREMAFRAIEHVLPQEACDAYRALQDWQDRLGVDDLSDLVYQANFRRLCEERGLLQEDEINEQQMGEICAYASKIQRALREKGLSEELLSYYAILAADGDRMGATLDALESVDEHRRFSRQVDEFAKLVPPIVEAHKGFPVYCGGDDVLALLPVNYALACAHKLQETFRSCMRAVAPQDTPPPTLSAGIAIVHAKENLQVALEWARAAEKHAKETRNALAVARYPRSGAMNRARTPWERFEEWGFWENAFRKGLADALPYELRQLARDYCKLKPRADILRGEALRVLERKEKPQSDIAIPDWVQTVDDLCALSELMLIARFLADYPEVGA